MEAPVLSSANIRSQRTTNPLPTPKKCHAECRWGKQDHSLFTHDVCEEGVLFSQIFYFPETLKNPYEYGFVWVFTSLNDLYVETIKMYQTKI